MITKTKFLKSGSADKNVIFENTIFVYNSITICLIFCEILYKMTKRHKNFVKIHDGWQIFTKNITDADAAIYEPRVLVISTIGLIHLLYCLEEKL